MKNTKELNLDMINLNLGKDGYLAITDSMDENQIILNPTEVKQLLNFLKL